MRVVVSFLAGFVAGMIFLLALLWNYGSLRQVRAAPALQPTAAPAQAADVPALMVPVEGADMSHVTDTFNESRGRHSHQATDIMAPRGTPVLAAGDGAIVKLFLSRAGGITIYEFDPTQTWCYYYAHLDRYAAGIQEGMTVHKGQTIGYVGSTGDASAEVPHLHFEIHRLGPEKHWWQGTPVDPYPILLRSARK